MMLLVLYFFQTSVKTLKAELNPICHLLALLGAHHILHVSKLRANSPVPLNSLVTPTSHSLISLPHKTCKWVL